MKRARKHKAFSYTAHVVDPLFTKNILKAPIPREFCLQRLENYDETMVSPCQRLC